MKLILFLQSGNGNGLSNEISNCVSNSSGKDVSNGNGKYVSNIASIGNGTGISIGNDRSPSSRERFLSFALFSI